MALLTQDAEPADERWLERLLAGFALADDVGIVYGPYRPRPDAAVAVRVELERWFASLAPDGEPTVERLDEAERAALPALALIGRRGFFTDANACLARAAWERVPFREVPYAEDRVLAIDMLRAGYAKAFVPAAAVWHSHDYTRAPAAAPLLRRVARPARGLRLARAAPIRAACWASCAASSARRGATRRSPGCHRRDVWRRSRR